MVASPTCGSQRNKVFLGRQPPSRPAQRNMRTRDCGEVELLSWVTMLARVFVASALGAFASACAQIPDLTFADADAPPIADASQPPPDGEGGQDATTSGDAATPPPDSATPSDAAMNRDAPNPSSEGGLCPPANAPAGAQCCGDGKTPCIGPACGICKTTACKCAPGEYCCATENPKNGKVTGTNCSAMPTGPMCPTQ
jgi:hypothetical protein